jgi:spermidine synthase
MTIFSNILELARAELGIGGRMKRRKYRTMAGKANVYEIIYDDGKPVRVMNVKGTYQSATYLDGECYELVFGYHRAYNALFQAGLPIHNVAMLGGGGFSYPKYLISHYPDVSVDAVEIDPMVVSIAERWFYLDRLMAEFDIDETGRLGIFVQDAREFLEEPGRSYDAIGNDCFSARGPVMSLATCEAARAIHARLNPGGLYLTNVISALRGPRAKLLHSVMETLGREFAHVHVVPGSEFLPRLVDNYVVIATDGDYRFEHSIDVQPEPGTEPLVDEFIEDYEDEFFLIDT